MKIVTESELRASWKHEPFKVLKLTKDEKLTPAAREFLSERRIELLYTEDLNREDSVSTYKPEHLTHLRGSETVPKNDARIRLRGRLDSLYAEFVEMEITAQEHSLTQLKTELRIQRKYINHIICAEASGQSLEMIDFYGWSSQEIRERSHETRKYYGTAHFRPHPDNGIVMARLNRLRTRVREVEVEAVSAYCSTADSVEREDIIRALNRLSSILYIQMCVCKTGGY